MHMKIGAPFDTLKEILPLIKAGADELYCGVYSDTWKKIGIYPNARYMAYGNLENFRELNKALLIAKEYEVPVYLCINEFLGAGAIGFLLQDIARAIDIGIDGFILADFNLIPSIKKLKQTCKIILSSLNPCFNRSTLRVLKNLGVDRIVLPYNQLTLDELEKILKEAQDMSIETEMFVHSDVICKNINGYCLYNKFGFKNLYKPKYRHGYNFILSSLKMTLDVLGPSLKRMISKMIWSMNLHPHISCREKCDVEVFEKIDGTYIKREVSHEFKFNMYYQHSYCALCLLWLLNKIGLTAGKIPGRGSTTERKIKNLKSARKYLDAIEKGCINDNNFEDKARDILRITQGRQCSSQNCYHIALGRKQQLLI